MFHSFKDSFNMLIKMDKSNFTHILSLILTKSVYNIKSEFSKNRLGYIWVFLEPLLYILTYYVVFKIFLNNGTDEYISILITGLVPWLWFMKSIAISSTAIINNQSIILNSGTSPIVFPFVSILQISIRQFPTLFFILMYFILKYDLTWASILCLCLICAFQLIVIIFSSILVSLLVVYFRDLQVLIPSGLTLLMFISGVFFSRISIPDHLQDYFLLNPIALFIESYRSVIFNLSILHINQLIVWSIILIIGIYFIVKYISSKKQYIALRLIS